MLIVGIRRRSGQIDFPSVIRSTVDDHIAGLRHIGRGNSGVNTVIIRAGHIKVVHIVVPDLRAAAISVIAGFDYHRNAGICVRSVHLIVDLIGPGGHRCEFNCTVRSGGSGECCRRSAIIQSQHVAFLDIAV